MHKLTVATKGVAKRFNGLNVHEAPGPGGLNARLLKRFSNISPILVLIVNIVNKSLAQDGVHVPNDSRQAKFSRVLKGESVIQLIVNQCS